MSLYTHPPRSLASTPPRPGTHSLVMGKEKGGGGAGRPDPDEVSPETHQNAVSRGSTSDVELH